jgi:hypothetical protein
MRDVNLDCEPTIVIGRASFGREARLPGRDWILLPLLSLLTISLLMVSLEILGRLTFHTSYGGPAPCIIRDPSMGLRGIPNSVCWEKEAESQPVEYRFNGCGHRTGVECGSKAPGTYRIVMTGSSFAMGSLVQQEGTFAALLPAELSRQTGRKIELYNEGLSWRTPLNVSLGFNDVLKAQPDVILWILTPWDMDGVVGLGLGSSSSTEAGMSRNTRDRVKKAFREKSLPKALPEILGAIHERWSDSDFGTVTQHYLYQSQSEYVKLFLTGQHVEFLKSESNSQWQTSIEKFNGYAADIEGRAKSAGVPLVAVLVPNRAQATMISMGEWPAGYDPYKLDNELRSIITRHGGIYIDILPDFRAVPNPEQYYYPIDGHPNPEGHAIISQLLAKELTGGAVQALSVAAHPQAVQVQSR